jgi:hypothetical protein
MAREYYGMHVAKSCNSTPHITSWRLIKHSEAVLNYRLLI